MNELGARAGGLFIHLAIISIERLVVQRFGRGFYGFCGAFLMDMMGGRVGQWN